ncbi:MAG: RimJ/RimL family protein N-acetyltransferase [Candidatus Azotimanducaceae bacterium]
MIRLLDSKDSDSYRNLLLETVIDPAFSMDTKTITQMKTVEIIRQIQTSSKHICTGYFKDRNLIGFCHCSLNSESHCGVIWGMYIEQKQRLKGFGAELIGVTLKLARSHFDLASFELTTDRLNNAAIRLYSKHGFVYKKTTGDRVAYALIVDEK